MKDRNICCIYHVEIDELRTTFNNMLNVIHGSNCTCDYQIYVSISSIFDIIEISKYMDPNKCIQKIMKMFI
jgi:hypothetical protein